MQSLLLCLFLAVANADDSIGAVQVTFTSTGNRSAGNSYTNTNNEHSCCTGGGGSDFHRRCNRDGISESECKTLCDADSGCKGYAMIVGSRSNCGLATTSSCPTTGGSWSLFNSGTTGPLVNPGDCGSSYGPGGCYIKGAQVQSCDASTAPTNGQAGSCGSSLSPGASCNPQCDNGYFRQGTTECSSSGVLTPATCQACGACPDGQYRSGCTAANAGVCTACSTSCADGQYLANCGNQNAGTCQPCTSCSSSQYLSGCSGANPGTCKDKMKCTDTVQGFVDSGSSITSAANKFAKSCPTTSPRVSATAYCQTEMCLVKPDRSNCCRANICTCAHGKATIAGGTGATLCQTDDTEDCSECDAGYHLTAEAALGLQTCKVNTCLCEHGTATVGTGVGASFCDKDGETDCSSCAAGYHLSDTAREGSQKCVANVCTCSGGTATVATGSGGTLCKTDNTEDCSKCDAGFTLEAEPSEALQTCQPNPCKSISLDKQYDISGCRGTMTTGRSCQIGCADGYSGEAATWTCQKSGDLTGAMPHCEPQKCNQQEASSLFSSQVSTNNCTNATTGDKCVVTCNTGYSGASQEYDCDASGFKGEAMSCEPDPCDASHAVANGDAGDCTDSLPSGRSCKPTCKQGYTRVGVTDCVAGTLRSVASCEPNPCDASEPPKYGTAGDCTSNLASGATCQPTCERGYTPSGPSTCSSGSLTATTCKAQLQCHLKFKQNCADQYGYWSDSPEHLDYPGCEHFCNMMYMDKGKEVVGCELASVHAEERSTKGAWCFAHELPCSPAPAENTAASKCIPLAMH